MRIDGIDNLTAAELEAGLAAGGRFVFSVNVPEPAWGKVALHALPGVAGAAVGTPTAWLRRPVARRGTWGQ